MPIQNFFNKLWEADPGYFRIKQACKTILAILIIMAITYSMPLLVKILSAMAAGFSMQAIVGDGRKQQFEFIVTAFPIYFLCFFIGHFSIANVWLSNLVLIVLGFFAIYLRKFGPAFNFAPIIAWSFAFFGIILPINNAEPWLLAACLCFGLIVSALVYLLVLPERKNKLYYSNLNVFMQDYASILQWLAHQLIHKPELKQFQIQKDEYKMHLFQLTLVNGEIAQGQINADSPSGEMMKQLYTTQYALAKVMSMILEGFENSLQQNLTLSDTVRSHLFTAIAIYAAALSNLNIQENVSNHLEILRTLEIMETNLDAFQNLLLDCVVKQKQLAFALININLGLGLILKNIRKMDVVHVTS